MGSYVITIQAVGPHHNRDREGDANEMASAFVEVLQQAGHKIESATFTYGGRDELLPVSHLPPPLIITETGQHRPEAPTKTPGWPFEQREP